MGEEQRVNYSSPSDGGKALIIVCVVLSVVQIVFVAARFYTRYMQRMRCGIDDYVMLLALVRQFAAYFHAEAILILTFSPLRLETWPRQSSLSSVRTPLRIPNHQWRTKS
jgi:hypothetical protein